jgi:hypothetical protein
MRVKNNGFTNVPVCGSKLTIPASINHNECRAMWLQGIKVGVGVGVGVEGAKNTGGEDCCSAAGVADRGLSPTIPPGQAADSRYRKIPA